MLNGMFLCDDPEYGAIGTIRLPMSCHSVMGRLVGVLVTCRPPARNIFQTYMCARGQVSFMSY